MPQGYVLQDVCGGRTLPGRNLIVVLLAHVACCIRQVFEKVVVNGITVAGGGINTIVVGKVRNLQSLSTANHMVIANGYMSDEAIRTLILGAGDLAFRGQ